MQEKSRFSLETPKMCSFISFFDPTETVHNFIVLPWAFVHIILKTPDLATSQIVVQAPGCFMMFKTPE